MEDIMTTLIEEKNRQIADYKGLLNLANARNDLLQKEIDDLMQLFKYPDLFNEWRESRNPRVLTLEEVKQADVVWNEFGSVDGYVKCMLFDRIDKDGDLSFAERNGATIYFSPSEYNKSWRCWSARPTAEQMEQTGWVGEQE